MKKKNNKALLLLSIVSFVVATWEGYYFYADYSAFPFWQLLLILQNGIKTFFFMPQISLQTILNLLRTQDMSFLQTVVAHVYMVAVFLAPICTVTTVLKVLNVLLRLRNRIYRLFAREQYVIFGYDDDVEQLLQNSMGETKQNRVIHLITREQLPKSKEVALMKCKAVVYREDALTLKDSEPKRIERFFQKVRLKKAKHIFLMEQAADNFSLYILLSEHKQLLQENCVIHCSCDNEEIGKLLMNYHDEQDQKLDLTLFDMARLQIQSMYKEHPIYQYNLEQKLKNADADMNVHMLLVGFGRIGRQILSEAMNNGVLAGDSQVIIDIVDKNSKSLEKILANCFKSEQVSVNENTIEIAREVADGTLILRFHQLNVFEQDFARLLNSITGQLPLTYAAVCTKQSDVSLHALLELENYLNQRQESIPIALRMETGSQLLEYLNGNKTIYRNVFSIASKSAVLTFENLCRDKDAAEAIAFHAKYSSIRLMESHEQLMDEQQSQSTPQMLWRKLSFLKKESNRYLCYHNTAKQMLCVCQAFQDGALSREQFAQYVQALREQKQPKGMEELLQISIHHIMEKYFTGQDGFLIKKEGAYQYDNDRVVEQINGIPFVKNMAMLEHRRWCYFMLRNGWSCAPVNHGKTKKELEAVHQNVCLVNWELLCKQNPSMCIYDLMPFLIL